MKHKWTAHTFERDGVKLRYHKKGAGAALLLLHGITDSGLCWGRTADALAQNFTVYALDLRGHGESDAPASGFAYADYADDAIELLRANDLADALMMGHSFGARVGMTMAAAHPARVSKLILVDPPLFDIPENVPQDVLDAERVQRFEWVRALKPRSRAELIAQIHDESPNWSEDECAAWADSKLQVSPRIWQANGVQIASAWRATMERIVCPTLLVYGDAARGSLIDLSLAEQVIARLPYGQAAHVPNAGHSVHRDEFDALLFEVNAFLQTT